MVITALWAPVITTFDTIVEYFQSFLGYVTMPVVVVLLGGLFWRRPGNAAGFWTLVVAAPIGLVGFFTGEIFELHDVQFLYGTGLMLLLSASIFLGVTLATDPPDQERIDEVVWSREVWRKESEDLEGTPFLLNYRVMGVGLVVLTLVLVVLLI
jgi:solute:Na+ symporter, SSS family